MCQGEKGRGGAGALVGEVAGHVALPHSEAANATSVSNIPKLVHPLLSPLHCRDHKTKINPLACLFRSTQELVWR